MEKIMLNPEMGKFVEPHGYELEPKKEYIINLEDEFEKQIAIMQAVQMMSLPAMIDWHDWLIKNGFSADIPNPTNEFVSQFYGKKHLWKTNLSQGIVVKNKNDDNFYVVMECSKENTGFKYTKIILTLGGCM